MKMAAGQVPLEKCPHVTDEAKAALESASRPPIQLVTIGSGAGEIKIGNETQLYRHEEKFYRPAAVAVRVSDTLEEDAIAQRAEKIGCLGFERVGTVIQVNLVAIDNESGDAGRFEKAAKLAAEKSNLACVLMSATAANLGKAAAALTGQRPLLYISDPAEAEAAAKVAKDNNCPLAVRAEGLDALAELTPKISSAGVEEIVTATPPGPEGTGTPAILAAAWVVGLRQVFLLGGAQAIAALAYGTESVPRVDKILGAGGLFVTLAKKLVYGDVGIEALHGPTETLLIADEAADPALVAADLLAQAEHDPLATALLITPSARLAQAVQAKVARQMRPLSRRGIIKESLARQGAILLVADQDEALALANEYAPEHLCLLVADPWPLVGRVQNAGGIFVGEGSSEALGDYVIGPSHIMPTRGTARFASPLHVRDFCRVTSIFAVGNATARRLATAAQTIAQAEGLTAHAAAVAARER